MFDTDAHYKVEGYGGVAWYVLGYEIGRDEDYDWTGIETVNEERVRCIMVGDDRIFNFDIEDLTKIEEDEYCHECGQIGCKANV